MATAHVQGVVSSGGSATSLSFALPSAPIKGNLVCVGFQTQGSVTGVTVKDANGNVYAVTPGSPATEAAIPGQVWLAYWHAASKPSATINISWTTAQGFQVWADEFSHSGNCKFDSDAGASNPGPGGGSTVNTPTITPTFAGSLVYSSCFGADIIHPVAGATLGAWTGAAGAITNGGMSEYILSQAASNIAVNYTQNAGSVQWVGMVMAFMIDQAGHIQREGGTGNIELENLSGDIALET